MADHEIQLVICSDHVEVVCLDSFRANQTFYFGPDTPGDTLGQLSSADLHTAMIKANMYALGLAAGIDAAAPIVSYSLRPQVIEEFDHREYEE